MTYKIYEIKKKKEFPEDSYYDYVNKIKLIEVDLLGDEHPGMEEAL